LDAPALKLDGEIRLQLAPRVGSARDLVIIRGMASRIVDDVRERDQLSQHKWPTL